MKFNSTLAAALLMASGVVAAQAVAQTAPPQLTPAQQRLQNLKAQRDAKIAAAKAQQNQIQRPVPTVAPTPAPTPTPAPIATPTPIATARPTAVPTVATAVPTAATAAPTASAAPKASGGFASTTAASAVPVPKPPAIIGIDLEELKKTRPERRKVEIQALQARWGGELLRNTSAGAELKQHAQRTAFLQRIRALASKANDAKTVQAVDILITKEDTRDADAMNALRSGALPTVAAGAGK